MTDTPPRSGPGRLCLGLFLASAVVIFGAILTGYAFLRMSDSEAFTWAPKLLDRRMGWAAVASLIVGCLASAGAFGFGVAGKSRPARAFLAVGLLAGVATLVVRAIELPTIGHHAGFTPKRAPSTLSASRRDTPAAAAHAGDAAAGKRIFLGTCAACHAPDGSGVRGQGQNLRESTYLRDKTDEKALAFVKAGRQPFDPESKLHLAMPARGGNPSLSDANILDAIAYVRELQKQAALDAARPPAAKAAVTTARTAPVAPASDQPQLIDGELWFPHSVLPAAQPGPPGTVATVVALQKPGGAGHTESNIRRFFSIVLFAEGLHALYMVFGLILGLWLLFTRTGADLRGNTLALGAAYWVVIGAIGVLLVPAFYV